MAVSYSIIWIYCDSFNHFSVTAAKLLQSCPTLCDPIDDSPLGSSVPGILQARVLEWGATAFSAALYRPAKDSGVQSNDGCRAVFDGH